MRVERTDLLLLICVIVATICGVITLYTQEMNISDPPGKWYRQLIYGIVGIVLLVSVSKMNYQFLSSYALPIYILSIILLALTLVKGIGYLPTERGARSWIKLGPVNIQTSEFAKLATVILLGQYLVLKEREITKLSAFIVPFIIVLIPMGLIAVQPDFGTAISFLPILFAMLFMGGADLMHIGSLLLLGGFSLCFPMYVEYVKLTLVQPMIDLLMKNNKLELANLVSQLGGKVWLLLKGKVVSLKDTTVTLSDKNLQILREVAEQVIDENTNFIFHFFINDDLLFWLGATFLIVSIILLIIRYARGLTQFRQYYIPIGMLGLSLLAVVVINKTVPFRENQVIRLTAFLNPEQFKQGAGYQLRASKPAIGSGKFFGKGLGNGEMTEGKIPHVPESSTDFIFASWAEQTGFVGSVFLIFVLLAIPLRGLQISYESKDRFGSLLAAGIVALIFFHIFINLGIVMGLLPVTGLPLSFVSYGGSHLIMNMIAVGILISIKLRKYAN